VITNYFSCFYLHFLHYFNILFFVAFVAFSYVHESCIVAISWSVDVVCISVTGKV